MQEILSIDMLPMSPTGIHIVERRLLETVGTMKLWRHPASAAFAAIALALSLANISAAAAESDNPQEYLQANYHLQVTLQSDNRVSGAMHMTPLADASQLPDYLRAMVDECKKYPVDFFSKAGVSEIVLCGTLEMGLAPIAGVFVAPQHRLYVKFHWCQFGAHCRVTFHSFHHELGHALQTAALGSGHFDWREWADLNPTGFNYGNGGKQELMADPEKNWGTWSTSQPGFLNPYSTTAAWEDRSEIMASLMNDGDRQFLRALYQRDPVIQKKVQLMSDLLSKLCGPTSAKYFWEQSLLSLKTQPAVSLASNPASSSSTADLPKMLGNDLIDASGNAFSFASLKGKKYFLLYFSASWCPRCREFMPQFLEYYQNSKYRDKFEVLFVSSDRDEPQMLSYLREMPWKAVRFKCDAETFLKANYSRGPGIPALALVDSDGRLLAIKKGFAKNYEYGVDKMLDILNEKLATDAQL